MTTQSNRPGEETDREMESELDADRRKFLSSCGRFAAVTPPALTMLLSTSLNSDAIARSGGGGGHGGGGHREHGLFGWLQHVLDRLF